MDYTTKITTLFDEDSQYLMNDEIYPAYSHNGKLRLQQDEIEDLLNTCYNLKLNRYYACIEKAKIVADYLGIPNIHLGSLMVESTENGVMYGYYFNPPLELHAWVQDGFDIIDLAVAGTIELGSKTKDDVGYFLIGREPVVVAGTPPPWLHYTTKQVVLLRDVNVLDIETAKELIKNTIIWK